MLIKTGAGVNCNKILRICHELGKLTIAQRTVSIVYLYKEGIVKLTDRCLAEGIDLKQDRQKRARCVFIDKQKTGSDSR